MLSVLWLGYLLCDISMQTNCYFKSAFLLTACLHLKICCKELVDRRPGRAVRLESRETACVSSTSNQWQHVATADPPDKMFAPVESQEEVQGAAAKRGNSGTPQVELTSCSGQEKDENGAVPSPQEILRLIAFKYLRKVDLSTPEEFNGFVRYIEKVRKALIVDVTTGSLIVNVECSSLEILEGLWEDYRTGYLNKMVQKFLVTEEILEEFGLVEVKLTTTIKKEEYRACQELLSEIAGMCMVSPNRNFNTESHDIFCGNCITDREISFIE